MTPREWCTVSLVLGFMCLVLPFARANPFSGPFNEIWVTVSMGDAFMVETETAFTNAVYLFTVGVMVVYFHSGASLLMSLGLFYSSYISFVEQGYEPAFGFYIALAATLVGLYPLYKIYLSPRMPRKRRVVYAKDLWL